MQRCQQIHRDKLKHMKSTPQTLDNRAPKKHMHLILKQKKHQQEEERFAQIELENRILLDKMAKIMQNNPSSHSNQFLYRSCLQAKPGTRIDRCMYPVIDSRNYAPSKSLNRDKRMRELQRITEENQKMLQRIQSRRPFYDHNRWDEQHKRDLKYLENIRSRELLMIERARTPGTPRRPRPATMSPTRASALPGIAQRGGTAPVRSLAAGLGATSPPVAPATPA